MVIVVISHSVILENKVYIVVLTYQILWVFWPGYMCIFSVQIECHSSIGSMHRFLQSLLNLRIGNVDTERLAQVNPLNDAMFTPGSCGLRKIVWNMLFLILFWSIWLWHSFKWNIDFRQPQEFSSKQDTIWCFTGCKVHKMHKHTAIYSMFRIFCYLKIIKYNCM